MDASIVQIPYIHQENVVRFVPPAQIVHPFLAHRSSAPIPFTPKESVVDNAIIVRSPSVPSPHVKFPSLSPENVVELARLIVLRLLVWQSFVKGPILNPEHVVLLAPLIPVQWLIARNLLVPFQCFLRENVAENVKIVPLCSVLNQHVLTQSMNLESVAELVPQTVLRLLVLRSLVNIQSWIQEPAVLDVWSPLVIVKSIAL